MPMMGQPRARPSLLNQIVAPNRALPPPRPQGQLVGTPKPLPGLIQYGPQPQGLVQSSRFTGGSVPGGALNLTHPEQQPTFQEPQFTAPQAPQTPRLAPILAALAAGGMMGAPTGATAATPSPFAPPPGLPAPPSGTQFSPMAQQFAAEHPGSPVIALPHPTSISGGPPSSPGQVGSPTLASLIATLAQQGQRLGGNVRRL